MMIMIGVDVDVPDVDDDDVVNDVDKAVDDDDRSGGGMGYGVVMTCRAKHYTIKLREEIENDQTKNQLCLKISQPEFESK